MAEFSPPTPLTRDDLIDVLRRNLAPHRIEGLLGDPSSAALFEGMIALLLRVQAAIDENLSIGSYILTAPGPAPASSTVRLTRPSGAAVTLDVTHRFVDQRGAVWRPTEPFAIAASGSTQTVDVPVETERRGYFLNTFDPPTFQIVDALPDPNLSVIAGILDSTGGKTGFLDQHGDERKVFRGPAEEDTDYRQRIRFLEDVVSPTAIAETVAVVLDQYPATKPLADMVRLHGLRAVREPFVDSAQLAQDGLQGLGTYYFDDVQPIPLPAPIPDPGGSFVDDTARVTRDLSDLLAWFDVFLPTPVDPDEARQFYDDFDPDHGAFFDDPLLGFFDLPAGNGLILPIAALADELDRRRGGGVLFRIFLGEDVSLTRHPPDSVAQAGDWTDQAGSAVATAFEVALASSDGDDTYAFSDTGTANAGASAAGDLQFTFPPLPDDTLIAIRRVRLRARARRRSVAAGVNPLLRFVIKPPTTGSVVRVGNARTIDHDGYLEHVEQFDDNPITAADWTIADLTSGDFIAGLANVAAVGATEELRVTEFAVEVVADYG